MGTQSSSNKRAERIRRQKGMPACRRQSHRGARHILTNWLLAVIGFGVLVSGAVVLTLHMRGIYYSEISRQNLEQITGLTEEQIRTNYDVLIDYNLMTKGVERLEFPDFPMSETGRIHFEEVKDIFTGIQYMGLICGPLFLAGLIWKLPRGDFKCLKYLSLLTILVPSALGPMIAFFWRTFFLAFHRLFFRNDYWIFDEKTDPVINILPDSFFFKCAVVILLLIVAGGAASALIYHFMERGRKSFRKAL